MALTFDPYTLDSSSVLIYRHGKDERPFSCSLQSILRGAGAAGLYRFLWRLVHFTTLSVSADGLNVYEINRPAHHRCWRNTCEEFRRGDAEALKCVCVCVCVPVMHVAIA